MAAAHATTVADQAAPVATRRCRRSTRSVSSLS